MRSKSESDAVPNEEIDEITDRIELMELALAPPVSAADLSKVLASFEEQLLELNQALKNEASGRIVALRKECNLTRRAVEGLNLELDDVVKGHTG
jgi:chromosome segregation and condensation protein ScpB